MDENIFSDEADVLESGQQIFEDDDKIEVKPIEWKIGDDEHDLSSGDALNEKELYELAARKQVHFVYILGPAGSGKTTLEAMLYGSFARNIDKDILFAGSETLIGFEKRLWNIRAESGRSEIEMERTPKSERRLFLHLDLLDNKKEQHYNLIFSDISGETFDECCSNRENLEQELPYLDIAENLVLFIDGETLLNKALRHNGISKVKYFLQTLMSSQYYDAALDVDILISKNDKIFENTDKNIEKFIDEIEQNFKSFKEKFKLHFFRIESISGENLKDSETSTGLTELLKYWMNTSKITRESQVHIEKTRLKSECNRFGERY